MHFAVKLHHLFIFRKIVAVRRNMDPYQLVSGFFQFRSNHIFQFRHIHGKRYQSRRNVDIIEGSGHTVFSADGRKSESHLRIVCAQQSRKRLAPAGRILAHSAEVLLEGKADFAEITACRYDSGDGFRHRIDCAVIGAPAGYIRIKSITHHGDRFRLSVRNRYLCHHRLGLSHLIFSAIRHQCAGCPDGRVKHFHQPLLRACVQVRQSFQPFCLHIGDIPGTFQNGIRLCRNFHEHIVFLMRAIGIQERTGNVDDFFSSPAHHKARFLRYHCHLSRLQVFLVCIIHKSFPVLRINDYRHTFLGLRDCDFRSVQTGIFFRHLIQIDLESCRQLSDRHRNAACAEIVAFLDQKADLFSAEQSLQLSLCRSVSFLNLSAAGLNRLCGMNFGGTGGSTAAVASGTSAQKDNNIARIGIFTNHRVSRSSAEHRADLHTLCDIIRMIDFFYITGRQTNLVSVGTVAVSSLAYQLFLRKFSFQSLTLRPCRICRAGHTHCLVNIGTP